MFRRFRRQKEKAASPPTPTTHRPAMLPAPSPLEDPATQQPTAPLRAIRPEDLAAITAPRGTREQAAPPPAANRSRPVSAPPRQIEPDRVAEALEAYVNAPDWVTSRHIVEEHPELLSQTALMLLRANIVRVAEQVGPGAAQALSQYLQTLEVAQREGITFAFETMASPFAETFAPDLEQILALLESPAAQNLEYRVALCQAGMALAARDQHDELWAALQRELGLTLPRQGSGDHAANVEDAIEALNGALTIFTRFEHPGDWAMTQHYLGMAFLGREHGDRGGNVEQAIEHFEAALQMRTRESLPADWATTQEALGSALYHRLVGSHAENLDRAIGAFEAALSIRSREKTPFEWATDQLSLGNAYGQRINGTRMGNLEQAITGFEAALTWFNRANTPDQWALIHHNLGVAYMDRLLGQRAENIERALDHYAQVLQVQTRDRLPLEWADTRNNLGNAYRERVVGDRAANLQEAIACYQDALRVRARDVFPAEHRRTARNLGMLLFELGRWTEAHDVLSSALGASETLYILGLGTNGPTHRLRDHAELVAMDAVTLARTGRPRDAAQRLENGRARALDEMLERDWLALRAATTEARLAFENAQSRLQAAIDTAQQDLLAGRDRANDLLGAQAALDAAIIQVRQARPDFLHPPLTFKQIANAGSNGQALVYLAATSQGTLALIVPSGQSELGDDHLLWVPDLTIARIEQQLPILADSERVVKTAMGHLPRPETLDALLTTLGRDLMIPLATRLTRFGIANVILIPGGKIATVPLHAVAIGSVAPVRDTEGEIVAPRADALFADAFEVAYCPSAQRLLAARAGSAITLRSGVAAIGNPQPSAQSLLWSEHEAEAVAQVTHRAGQSCTLLIRRQATAEAVSKAIRDRAYIHLACANAFYPERPLDSFVDLAGDDRLKLADILSGATTLRGVRLLALSAGQSAMTAANGPDESVGMAAAMLFGGASGVITSLWPASDLATLLLMRRFAELYLSEEQRPAQALRNAQSWLRHLTLAELQRDYAIDIARDPDLNLNDFSLPKDCPYAHPLYWAGFVLFGV